MNPREVASKRFEKGFGYKQDDVDSFLKEVANEYANAVREKEENEAKIVKLVEKINEYRSDESAIGNALLVAQKQANKIVADAKEEAARIISEAQSKQDAMVAQIAGDLETVKRIQIEKIAVAIKDENDKLNAVTAATAEKTEQARRQLDSLKAEITEFKLRLLTIFEQQIKLTAELPELSDDEIAKILSGQVKPASQPAPAASDYYAAELGDRDSEMISNPDSEKSPAPVVKPQPKKPSSQVTAFGHDFTSETSDHDKRPDQSLGFSEVDYKKQDHSFGDLKFGQNNGGNTGKK